MNQEAHGPGNRIVEVSGGAVSVDEYGQGPAVLLLHGIPGWRGTWARVAAALQSDYRVIVPDLLGFGDSIGVGADIHAEPQADALAELLEALDVSQVHVVGFDFGGPIAVRLYARRPDAFLSLTLIATNTFVDTPVPGPLKLARVPVLGRIAFRALFGKAGLSMLWFGAVRARQAYPLSKHRQALASARGVRSTEWVFFESLRDLPGRYAAVQQTLPTVSVPTRVIWSEGDPFFPLIVGERLQASIPGATLVTVPGVGHFIPEEAPEATALHLRRHFKSAVASPVGR